MATFSWFHRLCEESNYWAGYITAEMEDFLITLNMLITWRQSEYLYNLEEAI